MKLSPLLKNKFDDYVGGKGAQALAPATRDAYLQQLGEALEAALDGTLDFDATCNSCAFSAAEAAKLEVDSVSCCSLEPQPCARGGLAE